MARDRLHHQDEQQLNALRRRLMDILSDPHYKPRQLKSLLRDSGIRAEDRPAMELIVREAMREGHVVELKQKGLALAEAADLFSGRISFTRSGAAFVSSPQGDREVFVRAGDAGVALPGDQVLVRVRRTPGGPRAGKSVEGKVVRVVQRKTVTVVGELKRQGKFWIVAPLKSSIPHDVYVPGSNGANPGDRVLVRLDDWEDVRVSPTGEITEVIGPADNPSLDTLAVIKSNNLPDAFSGEAVAEAEAAAMPPEEVLKNRLDLRRKFVFTIDPATARDFDDAISLEKVPGGRWRLGVHIADVSHFVRPGTILDDEAQQRGTSCYFPDTVIPMLPEQLSNGLCSLNPDVDRLAFSALLTLDDDGTVHQAQFRESVIRSKLRLTYEQALEILEAPEARGWGEHGVQKRQAEIVRQVHALAQTLRQRRIRQEGALMLDLPDTKIVLGDDGRIADVVPVPNDISHQLIEECMLLANEYVCRELVGCGAPLLRRIHEDPDPEKLGELADIFRVAGVEPGDLTQRDNLVRLVRMIDDQPQAHAWYTSILRSFKRARYDTRPVWHYGLGKEFYAHFTSPIRRYPDLIVHRQLKALLAGGKLPYRQADLVELGRHCSEREDVATEAEREILDIKKLRFFSEQLESGNLRSYQAVVTEVTNYGVFIDVPAVQTIGLIHISQLADDFFDFNPGRLELRGRATGQVFALGCTFDVVIARVDHERRLFDFAPVAGTVGEAPATPRDKDEQPTKPGPQQRERRQEEPEPARPRSRGKSERAKRQERARRDGERPTRTRRVSMPPKPRRKRRK